MNPPFFPNPRCYRTFRRIAKSAATILLAASQSAANALDLTFEINPGGNTVAIQFDVSATGAPVTFGTPDFQGASPHRVESNAISSGATRFVVYSTTGLPISTNGRIKVTLTPSRLPANGMITVSGVVASNASGIRIAPDPVPNALPAAPAVPGHLSAEIGISTLLSAPLVDPDGTVTGLTFRLSGAPVATAPPGATSAPWTPSTPGLFNLTVDATDNKGQTATLPLATVRAYSIGELSTLATFNSIHYGSAAPPDWLTPDADPMGIGVPNILAHLFGINPNSPDHSRLPGVSIETDGSRGREMVFRFHRPTTLTGVNWSVFESENLQNWTIVAAARRTETPLGDGRTRVEARRAVTPASPKAFMNVQATPAP